ncbi:response regulator transcription factor [candidate division CSSED10-310 bacterium]|uniref:Response regulator transcription factor n=1 Tax=candidate division CSSED10-310 bacterium TaxID=2855610 RepID=A0ABV6YRY5_UNCC1
MSKKILVVDDQKRYRDEVTIALKSLQVKIILAEDGLDGLVKFRKEKPDIVIIDAMLPKLHGFQLCKTIKSSISKDKKVVIFIITGIFPKEDYESDVIAKYGADEFITKPFSRPMLKEKVEFYLNNMDH